VETRRVEELLPLLCGTGSKTLPENKDVCFQWKMCYQVRMRCVLDDVAAEASTDDGWTLVQCKCKNKEQGCNCKSRKLGLKESAKRDRGDHNNVVREQNRFTMVNKNVRWNTKNGTTLKESVHEHDGNRDREPTREGITIEQETYG
jgi:hypothetical protein